LERCLVGCQSIQNNTDMKKAFLLLSIVSLLFFISCNDTAVGPSGPVGSQGPTGLDGLDGLDGLAGETSYIFEYDNINFTAPNYEVFLAYPSEFDGLGSDVALIYLLWGEEEVDGDVLEIWRLLPQTILFTDGTLQYNYDFTKNDARLFLGANFPLDELSAMDTDQWVARVVVIPGEFFNARLDFANYREIEKALGLDPKALVYGVIPTRRNL
jgi:hypothetical protein